MASSASVHLDGDEGEEDVDGGEEVVEVGVEGDDSSAFVSWNKERGGVTGTEMVVLALAGCGDGVAIRASSRSFLDFGGDATLLVGAGLSSHIFTASTLLLAAEACDSSSHLLAGSQIDQLGRRARGRDAWDDGRRGGAAGSACAGHRDSRRGHGVM